MRETKERLAESPLKRLSAISQPRRASRLLAGRRTRDIILLPCRGWRLPFPILSSSSDFFLRLLNRCDRNSPSFVLCTPLDFGLCLDLRVPFTSRPLRAAPRLAPRLRWLRNLLKMKHLMSSPIQRKRKGKNDGTTPSL